jgi:hypothetical protein
MNIERKVTCDISSISGDDGEDSFHQRWDEELEKL